MRTPRVTFITTIRHNVGDDFVREGIQHLLGHIFGSFEVRNIHKHIPVTVRPEWAWIYSCGLTKLLDRLPRGRGLFLSKCIDGLPLRPKTDAILSCDLLVQSGAPVYWSAPDGTGCHNNEWYAPLIVRRFELVRQSVPLLNLGAGTCQPYGSDGAEVANNALSAAYIRDLYRRCRLTIVRDRSSLSVLNKLGLDAPLLPCPSIFARDQLSLVPNEPRYVVLNYMRAGGHYRFGLPEDAVDRWEAVFREFWGWCQARFPVIISCHDRSELRSAKRLVPRAQKFYSPNAREYLELYSKARFYVGSRVHAAMAVASFGRPAHVIGNDTRSEMVDTVGLERTFAQSITVEKLQAICVQLEERSLSYAQYMSDLRRSVQNDYRTLIAGVLNSSQLRVSQL